MGTDYFVPYVFPKFPETDDPFFYEVVVGRNVWLRENPGAHSRGLRRLSWDVVRVEADGADWHKITTDDGLTGYVAARYLHSPAGYRARFRKDAQGQWRMTALLAGD